MGTLEKFNLKSLGTMDGERIAIAFEQELKRVVMDCDDRPGDKTARSVTLTLAVKPKMDVDGICDDCDVQVSVTGAVPKRKSKVFNMTLKKGGHLMFNNDSLENAEQGTLDLEE